MNTALQLGVMCYIREYMRERGSAPRGVTWNNVVEGVLDFRGEGIFPEFVCHHCGRTRRVHRRDLPAFEAHVGPAYCTLLVGESCENSRPEGEIWEWAKDERRESTLPLGVVTRLSSG